ncbi:MAG: hypothetical protein IPH04_13810 [Saprospirales bacterium]|nr:hypothetical protein [Saprospirales bacterium]
MEAIPPTSISNYHHHWVPKGTYEIQTDYWSVPRFSFCPDGGGGMMLQNMREGDFDELDELAPFDREE